MSKLAIAAISALVGYVGGVAVPAFGQGAVGNAISVPLNWGKQFTGAYEGKDIFAAPLQPDGSAELIIDARDSVWTLVRRAAEGTPDNPTGRLVTCEVDISNGIEPTRLTLRDLSGEYVLRAGPAPTVTWAPRVPNPFAGHGAPQSARPQAPSASERACQTLAALQAFDASPSGQLRPNEAGESLRLRCSAHMKARGFEDNVCFPRADDNPHPVCLKR